MINRILIRIKVVQMLYSYLLVEKDFSLEARPESPTKEKRFAYALYLDLLVLMKEIAESVGGRSHPLLESRFVKGVCADERMRSLMAKYRMQSFPLADAVTPLAEKIKESAVYKRFIKKNDDSLNADVDVWLDLINTVIFDDPTLRALISRRENYTLRGLDRAREMMDDTFVNFYSSYGHIPEALATLQRSLDAARELYMRFLLLPIELTELRDRQLDENRHKYIVTDEDLNPNLRFVENQLVAAMAADPRIAEFREKSKISGMAENRFMLTALLKEIVESDLYKEYMEAPITDFHTDTEFWRNVFKQIIFRNENFLAELEDKSVFWNDDVEIIGTFLLKTLKRFDEATVHDTEHPEHVAIEEPVLDMYKDEEDARFGAELLTAAIRNKEKYREYIDEFINKSSWDTERIPFMDVVVLLTAIAEIANFPKIPASVSVNEYIEIGRYYSTRKSPQFIHGILGSVITKLNEEGVINKR